LEEIAPDERYMAEIHIAKHRNGPIGMVKLSFNENCTSFRNLENRMISENKSQKLNGPPALRPKSDFVAKPPTEEQATPQF